MARVLVAYGTRHGGTAGIAEQIGETLRRGGHDVDVVEAGKARLGNGYDALVVGSSLYAGMWRGSCKRLVRKVARKASETPLWLFHSGPLGETADEPQPFPKWLAPLEATLAVRNRTTFGGVLDESTDGFIAKKMVQNGKGGDYRDWQAVTAWAEGIAGDLAA
jgi:menaquinone-dependent protoporphyrinogen oxidase